MADNIDEELHQMVKDIVDELEAVVAGTLYDVNGNETVIEDLDQWKESRYAEKVEAFEASGDADKYSPKELSEAYKESCIGTVDDIDEPDAISLERYIEKRGLGDTRFEVNSSKELCGGRTLFTFGGPNIWVHDNMVCGYWGSAKVEMTFNPETGSAMFDWFKEYWEVVKA